MAKLPEPAFRIGTAKDGRRMHYSVGAIVTDLDGNLPLFDRRYEPYGWASMAGHMDEGETDPLEVVKREGSEELGTELFDVEFLCEGELPPWNACHWADAHYWYLYRARVDRAKVKVDPHEAKAWKWYSPKEAMLLWPKLEPVWAYWFAKYGIV